MKRLLLQDLTDQHLTWLRHALDCSVDMTTEQCFRDVIDGKLALYEVAGGVIGLRKGTHVWVDLLAGKDMKSSAEEILQAIRHFAKGQDIEGFVINPAVARFYERLGFKKVGTYMRLEGDGRTTETAN